ncbi:MAG: hypothetical protein ACOC0Q_01425 [Wenzhouxiangella sp.]
MLQAEAVEPFGLWPENIEPVELGRHCQLDRQIGAMGGQVWLGCSSQEIEAVMRLRGVKKSRRWATLQSVRCFLAAACNELNRLESERADRARSKNR